MSEKKSNMSEKVLLEHKRVREEIDTITEYFVKNIENCDFDNWRLDCVWKLRDFRNHLVKHFDFEELGGFMKDVLVDSPESASLVKKIEAQHGKLTNELDNILDDLKKVGETGNYSLEDFRNRIKNLIVSLRAHESAENDLIQRVYSQEYGYPA